MAVLDLQAFCDAGIFGLVAKFHIEPHDVIRSGVA